MLKTKRISNFLQGENVWRAKTYQIMSVDNFEVNACDVGWMYQIVGELFEYRDELSIAAVH